MSQQLWCDGAGRFTPDTGDRRDQGAGHGHGHLWHNKPSTPSGNGVGVSGAAGTGIISNDTISNGAITDAFMSTGRSSSHAGEQAAPQRVVVAWWPEKDIRDLREGLCKWLPDGSHVSVVCRSEPLVRAAPPWGSHSSSA